jgi:gamma-glutamyltranspeptidase / glutathione hydrolase
MQLRSKSLAATGIAAIAFVGLLVALAWIVDGRQSSDADGAAGDGISVTASGNPSNPAPATAASDPPPSEDVEPADVPPGTHVQAVVSAHDLATQAGLEVLEMGGSAADSAVAVAAALSVVEPWFSSALGGGTWALYYDAAAGTVTSLDGVGPTGSLATPSDYGARAGNPGIHQANVPGAWDGWMLWLAAYGRLDLGDVLAPAIRIAREGYPIGPQMADWMGRSNILGRSNVAAIYAPNGTVLQQGDIVHQHEMAATFEALVAAYDEHLPDGRIAAIQAARDYFYRGPLAEAIVAASDAGGGYLTIEDFHGFEARIVEPLAIEYRDGISVFQNPPNSQGITMLLALNVLKEYDFAGIEPGSAEAIHLQAEAIKLAFADRYHHVGDPDRVEVPVAALLSDEHAARQRARIDMNRALTWPIADVLEPLDEDVAHTTTFHVVDRDGNGAAVTTSLGAQFLVIGDTGIHINNRMRFLTPEAGNPNQVAAGFKVRHTSNPYMAFREGALYLLGGNTGADVQSQGQVQQFIRVVEFGYSAQEAVDAPRFVSTAFPSTTHPWVWGNTLRTETGTAAATISGLQARGHAVESFAGGTFGNANMIVLHPDGTAEVGAEPRNGTASGVVVHPE